MISTEIISKIKLAVEIGLVDPNEPMFSDKYANVWEGMLGPNWKDDILLAIYEMAAKQVQIMDMAGPINPN